RDDQGLRVRDLGSTNGTRVNDTVIADWTTLSAGDVVSIGTTTITVVDK
ncbi:MAG: FHA domain-containing protein, partial [Acidimicrobiia bacterium]|nr:FHA domain-containing protein [Acidimicrobiia bacterium]